MTELSLLRKILDSFCQAVFKKKNVLIQAEIRTLDLGLHCRKKPEIFFSLIVLSHLSWAIARVRILASNILIYSQSKMDWRWNKYVLNDGFVFGWATSNNSSFIPDKDPQHCLFPTSLTSLVSSQHATTNYYSYYLDQKNESKLLFLRPLWRQNNQNLFKLQVTTEGKEKDF